MNGLLCSGGNLAALVEANTAWLTYLHSCMLHTSWLAIKAAGSGQSDLAYLYTSEDLPYIRMPLDS